LPLTREAAPARRSKRLERYHYASIAGAHALAARAGARWPSCAARAARAGATSRYPDAESACEAKRLMRVVLDHYLEARRIFSRRVVQDLQALETSAIRPHRMSP
jgi:hypothetical protein